MANSKEIFLFSALFLSFNSFLLAQNSTTSNSESNSQMTGSLPLTNPQSDTLPIPSQMTGSLPLTNLQSDTLPLPSSTTLPSMSTTSGFVFSSTTESLQSTPTVTTSAPGGTVADCKTEITLGNYCADYLKEPAGQKVLSYFKLTTSLDDLLGMIIREDTQKALTSQCQPGEWCLSDLYHENIYHGMTNFYASPICSTPLWNCLQSIAQYRQTCSDENELFALLEMISLLCDMNAVGDLQPECFTKTIEILHVLFTDANRGSLVNFHGPLCANYTEKIVKTFLCTVDDCGLKQTVFLKEFDPLANIAINSEMVFIKCNLSMVCSDNTTLAPRADFFPDSITNYTSTATPTDGAKSDDMIIKEELAEQNQLDQVFDQLEKQIEQDEQDRAQGKTNADGSSSGSIVTGPNEASWDSASTTFGYGNDGGQNEMSDSTFMMGGDQTMLFGTITLSTLVAFGLIAIGFMSCRHFRKRSASYKKGYSQLSEEESRMLSYE